MGRLQAVLSLLRGELRPFQRISYDSEIASNAVTAAKLHDERVKRLYVLSVIRKFA
jgi:protein-disulfide isomerase-like protein with CxxC motif